MPIIILIIIKINLQSRATLSLIIYNLLIQIIVDMYNIYFGVIDIIYTNENLIITCIFRMIFILVNYILDFNEKKEFKMLSH